MKWKILMFLGCFLLLSTFVLADVTQTSPSFTWIRNETTSLQSTFNITNNGNETLSSVIFSMTDLQSGSTLLGGTVQLTPNPISLNSGETKEITVTVSGVPTDQELGTYAGTITSSYSGNSTDSTISVEVDDLTASINVPSTIDFSNVNRNSTFTQTFTIENDGNQDLTNIQLSSSIDSNYNPTFNVSTFSLQAGESEIVELEITIPDDEAYGDKTLGSISVVADEKDFGNVISVTANVASKLNIEKVYLWVGDYSKKTAKEDDVFDNEAKPGDKLVFEVRVDNLYDNDDDDIEIQDIIVNIVIKDADDGDDFEEESDEFDVEADEDHTVDISFELAEDIDDGKYDVIVEAEGDDDNDIRHKDTFEFQIEVDRKKHEIIFDEVTLVSDKVKCGDVAQLRVEAKNIGSKDEDEVKVIVISDDLNYEKIVSNIELDSDPDDDDTYTNVFEILVPEDAEEDTYKITAKVYYDSTILDDAETVVLTVYDCDTTTPTNTTTPTTNTTTVDPPAPKVNKTTTQPSQTNVTTISNTAIPTTTITTTIEDSFFDSNEYLIVLVLLSVVAILLIVIIITNFIPKKGVNTT
ncbi:putative S-layer protein [Nanoarchaeota archaeon]